MAASGPGFVKITLLLVVVGAVAAAGCSKPAKSGATVDCQRSPAARVLAVADTRLDHPQQGTDWQTVFLLWGEPAAEIQAFRIGHHEESPAARVESLGGAAPEFVRFTTRGDVDPDDRYYGLYHVRPGCEDYQIPGTNALGEATGAGPAAEPAQGALVYTAGFWTNGTLFYTNLDSYDDSEWPRAGWYAWEGGDALPVYVYDQDRGEQPPEWKGLAQNVGSPGTPADAEAQGAVGMVDSSLGLGYFTTIKGFNEALKGLTTTTTKVVVIPPEDAYTRAGNEDHPLYGDTLVFLIRVVAVHEEPCARQVPEMPGC